MSRFVQRPALLATCLAGALLASGGARADAPRLPGLSCAGSSWASERLACRQPRMASRRVRAYRQLLAEVPVRAFDPGLPGTGRYATLLILGVGY